MRPLGNWQSTPRYRLCRSTQRPPPTDIRESCPRYHFRLLSARFEDSRRSRCKHGAKPRPAETPCHRRALGNRRVVQSVLTPTGRLRHAGPDRARCHRETIHGPLPARPRRLAPGTSSLTLVSDEAEHAQGDSSEGPFAAAYPRTAVDIDDTWARRPIYADRSRVDRAELCPNLIRTRP